MQPNEGSAAPPPRRTVRGGMYRVVDLVDERFQIRDTEYVGTVLVGPAILAPLQFAEVVGCKSHDSADATLIYLDPKQKMAVGFVFLDNVRLEGCELRGIGLVGPHEVLDKWKDQWAINSEWEVE